MPEPQATIDRYDPERYNVLLPTPQLRQQLGAWHQLTVSEVRVNPNPASGDVYPVNRDDDSGSGPVALAKPALYRIALAGGILWDPFQCRFERLDDDVAIYRAVGYLRMPDGSIVPIPETKVIDLRVVEADERLRLQKKAKENKELKTEQQRADWVEKRLRTVMIQWRKAYAARAETGAMLRVIRAAFGLKASYMPAELLKPFIVPRIDFAPDLSDPEVRRWVLARGADALRAFGWSPARPTAPEAPAISGPMRPALSAPPDAEFEVEVDGATGEVRTNGALPAAEPTVAVPPEPEPAPEPAPSPAPEPAPAAQTPPAGDAPSTNGRPRCEQCGRSLSEKVYAYSMEHYGKALCMNHQPRRRDDD